MPPSKHPRSTKWSVAGLSGWQKRDPVLTEKESHPTDTAETCDKSHCNRADSEADSQKGKKSFWSKVFAGHVGRDLEKDIRDVEDAEDYIVVESREPQVFLQASQSRIAWTMVSKAVSADRMKVPYLYWYGR